MEAIRDLDTIEQRILGALLEKSQATPDYYPMTLNSLIAACNQKSNRDPVSSYTEAQITDGLERLRVDVLAWRTESARSVKWSESITRRLKLNDAERAIVTLLLLRGPQTPGELRARSARLYRFDGIGSIEDTLHSLVRGNDPLAVELNRAPGQKERRWAHLLGGPVEQPKQTPWGPPLGASSQEASPEVEASDPSNALSKPQDALPREDLLRRLEALEKTLAEVSDRVATLEELLN